MARPILPWRSPLEWFPDDGQLVWVRRLPWYDRPVRATFISPDAFEVQVTYNLPTADPYVGEIPWYHVHSWKYQQKSDEDTFRGYHPGA